MTFFVSSLLKFFLGVVCILRVYFFLHLLALLMQALYLLIKKKRWGMVEECGSGRIGGVERIPWKRLFQACTLLPPLKMLGSSVVGTDRGSGSLEPCIHKT